MMGNFLTTLGAAPEEDRAMFEGHGLNVARQPDNASNPRPDNRAGWLSGETPDVVEQHLGGGDPAATQARRGGAAGATQSAHSAAQADGSGEASPEKADLKVRLWNPSTQLRFRAKRSVPPRPQPSPNRSPLPR